MSRLRFLRGGPLRRSQADLKLRVGKQRERRIRAFPRSLRELPETSARFLINLPVRLDCQSRGVEDDLCLLDGWKVLADPPGAGKETEQGRESVESIAERPADQDSPSRHDHAPQFVGARGSIAYMVKHLRHPCHVARAIMERNPFGQGADVNDVRTAIVLPGGSKHTVRRLDTNDARSVAVGEQG